MLKKQYHDPVTGDTLTLGEHISWMIQSIIRRWLFLGIITALTVYVWIVADPIWQHPLTDQWNLWASWLAIAIEGVTAMALINQTRRDAVVIREVRAVSREVRANSQLLLQLVQQEEQELQSIDQQLEERNEEEANGHIR